MRFKIFNFILLSTLFVLPTIGDAKNISDPKPHLLGLVLHPLFFEHLTETVNRKNEVFEVRECLQASEGFSLIGKFLGKISAPEFAATQSGPVSLKANVSDLDFVGAIHRGCRDAVQQAITPQFRVTLSKAQLQFYLFPEDMSFQVERGFLQAAAAQLKPSIENFPKLTSFIDNQAWKEAILAALVEKLELRFSNQIKDKLRGLIFLQRLYDVTRDSPLWKEGPILRREQLTLELDHPSPHQKDILFGFLPFTQNSVLSSPNGLEFYMNALFLTHDHQMKLTGLNPDFHISDLVLDRTRAALQSSPSWLPTTYERPLLPASNSEISMVLPSSLNNEAFETVYQERLLGFNAKIKISNLGSNLFPADAPEVYQLIKLNPLSAPKIHFKPDRLQLEISNYSMEIGTYIEDRIIPATQVVAEGRVSVSLRIDNLAQTLNMVLLPETFEIELKDLKNRLSEEDLRIFKSIAVGLWHDFIEANSELVLFPNVIESEKAPVKISEVRVSGETLLLDMDVDWKDAKL